MVFSSVLLAAGMMRVILLVLAAVTELCHVSELRGNE